MKNSPLSLHTAQVSASRIELARQRVSDPEWAWLLPELRRPLEAYDPDAFSFPAYDASWYRQDQPYMETYQLFHHYVNSFDNRIHFAGLRNRLLGGLILGHDNWRREAVDAALRHGEAIDFRVQHYDAGMEYSQLGWLLCDVYLGAADLLSDDEKPRVRRLLRKVADAVTVNLNCWRQELSRMAFSNHRICHMAILLALGKILEDRSLVEPVFDREDDRSFAHYLDGCMYDHGLCYESSTLYHFATSAFLLSAAKVSEALGGKEENLFHIRGANGLGLRDILFAPADLCFTGAVLPRSGDTYGADMHLSRNAGQFLVARGVYGEDPLSGALRVLLPAHALVAFCWLREMPGEKVSENPPRSRIFPEHGYAVLCRSDGLPLQAFLCGDASGIHHHREGLQLQVQIDGALVLGTADVPPTTQHGFSDSIHELFNRNPFSHSQLVVDRQDQQRRPHPVPIRIWEPEGRNCIQRMAMVDDRGELNPGVHQGRYIYIGEKWICDCVLAAAARERDWQLFYHLPAGPALNSGFAAAAEGLTAPAPLMRVDGIFPAAAAHEWESGDVRFSLTGTRACTLQRFVIVKEEKTCGDGVVAGARAETVAFVTLMHPPGPEARIGDLQSVPAGNEILLRWTVTMDGVATPLQARLTVPSVT